MVHLRAFEWFQVLQISGILSARCWKYLCLTCGSDETMFMKFVFKSGYRVNRNVLLLPCWFLQTNFSHFSSFVLACWHFNFYNFHFLSFRLSFSVSYRLSSLSEPLDVEPTKYFLQKISFYHLPSEKSNVHV